MNNTKQTKITNLTPKLLQSFKNTTLLHQALNKAPRQTEHEVLKLPRINPNGKQYVQQAQAEKKAMNFGENQYTLESEVVSLENKMQIVKNPQTELMIRNQRESRRERHIKQHQNNRQDKISHLQERLDLIEADRYKNLFQLCNKLEAQTMDVSFILEPEIKVLKQEQWENFEKCFAQKKEIGVIYLEDVNLKQKTTFEDFENQKVEKIALWRKLKHQEVLRKFNAYIKDQQTVNPNDRVQLYSILENLHFKIFESRQKCLDKLSEQQIEQLSKLYVEKWVESVEKLNNDANEKYDKVIDKLMKFHDNHCDNLKQYQQLTTDNLKHYDAKLDIEFEEMIQQELTIHVEQLTTFSKELLSQSIAFVEDSDFKSNEILVNIGNFYLDIAKKLDEFKKTQSKMEIDYQVEQAKAADTNDDTLDQLNSELDQLKEDLKRSIHHIQLSEILQSSFKKLDEIEDEYRSFHNLNVEIQKKHPEFINDCFYKFENLCVEKFGMSDESKQEELEQRNLERAKQKVKKMIEEEEEAEKLAEQQAIEEAKAKKGGKAPAPKKVDPKKAAAEYELKFETYLKEKVKIEEVEVYTAPSENEWLIVTPLDDIILDFYKPTEENLEQKDKSQEEQQKEEEDKLNAELEKQQEQSSKQEPEEKKEVDFKQQSPVDPNGQKILNENVVFMRSYLKTKVETFISKLFKFLSDRQFEIEEDAKVNDKDFIENSILILDERLKHNYPQKGIIEVEIYQERSAQITDHKQKYERHVRTVLDKSNFQTEEFNTLLEFCLKETKQYEEKQTQNTQALVQAQSLPVLQGLSNSVRDQFYKFGEKIRDIVPKLEDLVDNQINILLNSNQEFIKGSKLIENGGNYSQTEIDWYKDMIVQIDDQLQNQKEKRKEQLEQLQTHMNTKRQTLYDAFETQQKVTQEELAAKDGTGKKYGRPRRLAQERLATEQNKCTSAQLSIDDTIKDLKDSYKQFKQFQTDSDYMTTRMVSIEIRGKMMKLRSCMERYQQHIKALLPNSKLKSMQRPTYNEISFSMALTEQEKDEDKKRLESELESLGLLFYQKENKTFTEWIIDIEKQVMQEAQKLYDGPNTKFLTGADKIPDYLRIYLENMKNQCEDFRIQCCRFLRNSCIEFSEISEQISEAVFESIRLRFHYSIQLNSYDLNQKFDKIYNQSLINKQENLRQMRPNLSHPSCKEELDTLIQNEAVRFQEMMDRTNEYSNLLNDLEFEKSNEFFKALLNNFEFLITFYDCFLLFEDFNPLPGDDNIEKKHENLKNIIRKKQQGSIVDTSSERSIQKTWPGLKIQSFKLNDKELEYGAQPVEVEDTGKAGKKGGKAAPPKKAVSQELNEVTVDTKTITSFKTFRQKNSYHWREHSYKQFKMRFDESVIQIEEKYQKIINEETRSNKGWEKTYKQLLEE